MHYRAYVLDRENRIASAVDLDAGDDNDAIAQAQALNRAEPIELWQRDRKVGRIEPFGGGVRRSDGADLESGCDP